MEEERAKAVLKWLADLLEWVAQDPVSRFAKAKEELEKNSDLIKEAIEEAVRPEFAGYIEVIEEVMGIG